MSKKCCSSSIKREAKRCIPWALWELKQSVFRRASVGSVLNAAVTVTLALLPRYGVTGDIAFLATDSAFGGFASLIGLFLAFRASQAYARYREGATAVRQMTSEFFESASSLLSFTKASRADARDIRSFRHLIVRLFSMLNALVLADIEEAGEVGEQIYTGKEKGWTFELIDAKALDAQSLEVLRDTDMKVDHVYHWIQSIIVEAEASGVLAAPAPIVSRVFQEMNSAMLHYHEARQLSEAPFPRPYSAATKVVLGIHWLLTPFVAPLWANQIWGAALLAFIQVFMLWSLDAIADELENPFGEDATDLELGYTHEELNSRLLHLLFVADTMTPNLKDDACTDSKVLKYGDSTYRISFSELWQTDFVHIDSGANAGSYLKGSKEKKKKTRHSHGRLTTTSSQASGSLGPTTPLTSPSVSPAAELKVPNSPAWFKEDVGDATRLGPLTLIPRSGVGDMLEAQPQQDRPVTEGAWLQVLALGSSQRWGREPDVEIALGADSPPFAGGLCRIVGQDQCSI